jgi:hypothetical protein
MSSPSARRKRGQTVAAKTKEVFFETTFGELEDRAVVLRRSEAAQKASNVLLDLCRDHSYRAEPRRFGIFYVRHLVENITQGVHARLRRYNCRIRRVWTRLET